MLRRTKKPEKKLTNSAKAKPEFLRYLTVSLVVIAIIFGAGVKYARYLDGSNNQTLSAQATADTITVLSNPAKKAAGQIAVQVSGAVKTQGYYGMPKGTTVGELLERLSLTTKADTSKLDRTKMLADGAKLVIPSNQGVSLAVSSSSSDDRGSTTSSSINTGRTYSNDSPTKITAASGKKININTATASELRQLPNIGEKRAQAIIDYRKQSGDFKKISAIVNVDGIGAKTYQKIKDLICVD